MSYLPDIYQDFRRDFPEIARAYEGLARECHAQGPLDARTRRLIKLGIAIGLNSEGGVRSHARRALEEGITPEELHHAVLMAFTTAGYPYMAAALKWVNTVIETNKVLVP